MSTTKLTIPQKKKLAKLIIEGETSMSVDSVVNIGGIINLTCQNFLSNKIELRMVYTDKLIQFETVKDGILFAISMNRIDKYLKIL